MSDAPLKGKVAVITGASRGLGRAMALSIGQAGAQIACVGRDEAKLQETQSLLEEAGVSSSVFLSLIHI